MEIINLILNVGLLSSLFDAYVCVVFEERKVPYI